MNEEQAQTLLQQMQTLEAYLGDLIQKEEVVIRLLQEASGAVESMKALGNDSRHEALVPVGMGAYMKAIVQANEKMIVNIGAGTAIEQDKDSAINYVEARIKELEVALQQLAAQKNEVTARLEYGQREINKLMQSSSGSKQ